MQISKSEYMMFLKHPAWLWLKKHARHLLPPIDPALQSRFDEGHAFEVYAEALFPNLTRLGFSDFSGYRALTSRTLDAWRDGAEVISQGRYEDGPVTCISDIVSREGDGFILTEIKSSTSVKQDHVFDLAFQQVVLEASGFPIKRCEVAHVNRDYVRTGEINAHELVALTDITEKVADQVEKTRARIGRALKVAASETMPDPAPERARLKSYGEWLKIREGLDPPIPAESIYNLPFINAEQATKLAEADIETFDEIEDPTILNKSTRRYLSSRSVGKRIIDVDALDNFLQTITYPVYYFDYETTQSLVPPWDGIRPYQQVPFQYSLHVQNKPGGKIEHREYLHRNNTNPMLALLEKLREDIGDTGSILVWYEAFEKTRNKEMADTFPEHAEFLHDLNERVVDLMKPFAAGTISDPAFKGSASIKAVLPALIPELSYDDLDIREGLSAARLWKSVTMTNPKASERKKVYANLVDYCTRDTWAMVEIHRVLLQLT